jgi:hypothetical protein
MASIITAVVFVASDADTAVAIAPRRDALTGTSLLVLLLRSLLLLLLLLPMKIMTVHLCWRLRCGDPLLLVTRLAVVVTVVAVVVMTTTSMAPPSP